MSKTRSTLALLVIYLAIAAPREISAEPSGDTAQLPGTWYVVSMVKDGQSAKDNEIESIALAITKPDRQRKVWWVNVRGSQAVPSGPAKVHSAGKLGHIDVFFGGDRRGIFRVDGNVLDACWSKPGGSRPDDLAAAPGTGQIRISCVRFPDRPELAGPKPAPRPAPSKELQKVTWQAVEVIREGKPLDEARLPEYTLAIRNLCWQIRLGEVERSSCLVQVEEASSPKRILWLSDRGPDRGQIFRGIYELTSATRGRTAKDELKICWAAAGKPFPGDFSAKAGTGQTLIHYRISEADVEKSEWYKQGFGGYVGSHALLGAGLAFVLGFVVTFVLSARDYKVSYSGSAKIVTGPAGGDGPGCGGIMIGVVLAPIGAIIGALVGIPFWLIGWSIWDLWQ